MASSLPDDLQELSGPAMRELATEELVTAVEKGDEVAVISALARGARPKVTVPTDRGDFCCLVSLAARNGHDHLLHHLLQAGLNTEGGGTGDKTPLMTAALKGHTQTVKALLTLGANPLATDRRGWKALQFAARCGHQQCVAALLPVTPATSASLEAPTPVHAASYGGHVHVLQQLAGADWPLTSKDYEGNTPLHVAVMGGSATCVGWLVEQGGDLNVQNKAGHTPIDTELVTAVEEGNEARVISALANGARPEVTMPTLSGVLWCLVNLSARRGHDHLLPHLLQAGLNTEGRGTDDRTPLMIAAREGHTQTVKALLTLGANPLATDKTGRTALHWATGTGQQQCVAALIPFTPPTPPHLESYTPLHRASYWGRVGIMEDLMCAGWSLTARNSFGSTPLHHAAQGGHVAAVQLLMQRGGDPCTQDKAGRTPLDVAVQYGRHKVETWLIKNGDAALMSEERLVREVREWRSRHEDHHNKVFSWLAEGNEARIIGLIPVLWDGHTLNHEGLTPLHAAAMSGTTSRAVEALLSCGGSPHVLTPDKMTPADLARQKDHDPVIKGLESHHCQQNDAPLERLQEELLSTISHGDDVQAVSNLVCKGALKEHLGGSSALKLAVTFDRQRIVSLLLASGVSLSASLLQEAWQSPDVTHRVLAYLTTAYCCHLQAEKRRLEKVSDTLVKGIDNLMNTIEGNTPWQAAWRWGKDTDRPALSELLSKASSANCPVTAAFLHRAGAWPFFSRASGRSALHSALAAGHQAMAELLIRDLEGCPYVSDTNNCLPLHMMDYKQRETLEQKLFTKEHEQLENMAIRLKADHEKKAAHSALCIQEALFESHKKGASQISSPDARGTLLLASRKGLLQLSYLILQYTPVRVDEVLDDTCGTTALHQAASHGQDGCVELLLTAGANTQQCDTYGHTPRHLAAMFGHKSTFELLVHQEKEDPPCRAGTTTTQVKQNFKFFHSLFYKYPRNLHSPLDRHDPEQVLRNLVNSIGLLKLQEEAQRAAVDFSKGEALAVKEAVIAEVSIIMSKVSAVNPTYRGDLRLAGSSRDGSKLYAPDEFDINLVIHEDDVRVDVSERAEQEAPLKGRLMISIITEKAHLKGNRLMANLYEEVRLCLATHVLEDVRLSLVPPGLTSTQVGIGLSLAWQGQQYPLLLVSVDLVPVLEVPWLEQVSRPYLTPKDTTTIQLSNAADGTWRCSFALTEAKVLETLTPIERQVQLMGKVLLSRLKALAWMPRHKKDLFKWCALREFNVAVPSGFCLKNAVLRWVEQRLMEQELGEGEKGKYAKELVAGQEGDHAKDLGTRQEGQHAKDVAVGQMGYTVQQFRKGRKEDPARCLVEVFRLMCANPKDSREHLATQNSSAYFGGDCEGRKSGEGAPVIVQCLEMQLEKLAAVKANMLRQGK